MSSRKDKSPFGKLFHIDSEHVRSKHEKGGHGDSCENESGLLSSQYNLTSALKCPMGLYTTPPAGAGLEPRGDSILKQVAASLVFEKLDSHDHVDGLSGSRGGNPKMKRLLPHMETFTQQCGCTCNCDGNVKEKNPQKNIFPLLFVMVLLYQRQLQKELSLLKDQSACVQETVQKDRDSAKMRLSAVENRVQQLQDTLHKYYKETASDLVV